MVTTKNLTTEFIGLSTDTKPSNVRNGDTFIEMDTGVVFVYDGEHKEWRQFPPAE